MASPAARKLNILVVDDDPCIVRLMQTLLSQGLGRAAELTVVTDPQAALAWIDLHCCDILISDIEMPGLDGLALMRAAKSRNPWTQVVFVTGHTSLDRLTEAVELGAADYLLKPIEHKELLEVVSQLCRRSARWESAVIGTFALARN